MFPPRLFSQIQLYNFLHKSQGNSTWFATERFLRDSDSLVSSVHRFKYWFFETILPKEVQTLKAKPKESTMLLRLGIISILLGIIATAISPYSPTQLFAAFLSIGMFSLGLGVGFMIFSIRMSRFEKQNQQPLHRRLNPCHDNQRKHRLIRALSLLKRAPRAQVGNSAPFDLVFTESSRVSLIANYSLTA
jgi:hypothetical protein